MQITQGKYFLELGIFKYCFRLL